MKVWGPICVFYKFLKRIDLISMHLIFISKIFELDSTIRWLVTCVVNEFLEKLSADIKLFFVILAN